MTTDDDPTFKYGIEEVPYMDELNSIISEIRFGVNDAHLANVQSSGLASYFNLETKEGRRMCISMTRQGFRVVGNNFDTTDISDGKTYETINALLDSLSPRYREAFGAALTAKLKNLPDRH
ncbi:GSK3-beta interaction protein-like [Ornithodoros turicata]|uniref:GSK3-beta interaction protein-like n=1 Tax=Ornithodoros turicata TaxID=34597 RepID=UPI003138786B